MYRLTADSCPDGPCPRMARDELRRTVAIQGYLPQQNLDGAMRPLPDGETRAEMLSETFVDMLAEHLTDDELARLIRRRAALRDAA